MSLPTTVPLRSALSAENDSQMPPPLTSRQSRTGTHCGGTRIEEAVSRPIRESARSGWFVLKFWQTPLNWISVQSTAPPVHDREPVPDVVPAGHDRHAVLELEEANVPGGHGVGATLPGELTNVPGLAGMHERPPGDGPNVPAGHGVQPELFENEKDPAGHA